MDLIGVIKVDIVAMINGLLSPTRLVGGQSRVT